MNKDLLYAILFLCLIYFRKNMDMETNFKLILLCIVFYIIYQLNKDPDIIEGLHDLEGGEYARSYLTGRVTTGPEIDEGKDGMSWRLEGFNLSPDFITIIKAKILDLQDQAADLTRTSPRLMRVPGGHHDSIRRLDLDAPDQPEMDRARMDDTDLFEYRIMAYQPLCPHSASDCGDSSTVNWYSLATDISEAANNLLWTPSSLEDIIDDQMESVSSSDPDPMIISNEQLSNEQLKPGTHTSLRARFNPGYNLNLPIFMLLEITYNDTKLTLLDGNVWINSISEAPGQPEWKLSPGGGGYAVTASPWDTSQIQGQLPNHSDELVATSSSDSSVPECEEGQYLNSMLSPASCSPCLKQDDCHRPSSPHRCISIDGVGWRLACQIKGVEHDHTVHPSRPKGWVDQDGRVHEGSPRENCVLGPSPGKEDCNSWCEAIQRQYDEPGKHGWPLTCPSPLQYPCKPGDGHCPASPSTEIPVSGSASPIHCCADLTGHCFDHDTNDIININDLLSCLSADGGEGPTDCQAHFHCGLQWEFHSAAGGETSTTNECSTELFRVQEDGSSSLYDIMHDISLTLASPTWEQLEQNFSSPSPPFRLSSLTCQKYLRAWDTGSCSSPGGIFSDIHDHCDNVLSGSSVAAISVPNSPSPCSPPSPIEHGRWKLTGEDYTLRCSPGYTPYPTQEPLNCINGILSSPTVGLSCSPIGPVLNDPGSCSSPGPIVNGRWTLNNSGGYTLSCSPGYTPYPAQESLNCTNGILSSPTVGLSCSPSPNIPTGGDSWLSKRSTLEKVGFFVAIGFGVILSIAMLVQAYGDRKRLANLRSSTDRETHTPRSGRRLGKSYMGRAADAIKQSIAKTDSGGEGTGASLGESLLTGSE